MVETHRVAALAAATFMVVILCVSYVTEAASGHQASEVVASVVSHTAAVDVASNISPVVSVETQQTSSTTDVVVAAVPEAVTEPEVVPVPVTSGMPDEAPVLIESVPVALGANDSASPVEPTLASSDELATPFARAVATAIHEATNELRRDGGLLPVRYDAALARNAAGYSSVLLTNEVLSHTDPWGCSMTCRFRASGYVANAWGENLAMWESSYEPTVEEVVAYFMKAWEKSDGHRDNLLSSTFTHEGVGVARSGNTIYVTVHFAKP
jgi:uncharacterized protein YkwD